MREDVMALVERHLDGIRREARALHRDLIELGRGGGDLHGTVRRAHTLKGSSGSLGFAEVSRAAEAVEHGLRGVAEGRPAAGLRGANARLQSLAASATREDSSLWRRFA